MAQPSKIDEGRVVTEALRLLEAEGCEALSMRALARRLSVKAPSLYRYFPDLLSIEKALVERGNETLLVLLEEAVAGKAEAAAFNAAGEAYLQFARTRPHLYEQMMQRRLRFPAVSHSGKQLWNLVLQVVAGISGEQNDTERAVALWAFLHGFASLEAAGRFGDSGPRAGFHVGLDAMRKGFHQRSALTNIKTDTAG